MNKPLKELEEILKYNFKDKDLLRKALTHKSFNNKNNNEKLEFLGDRVLGLIISKKLLDKYPNEKEGSLKKSQEGQKVRKCKEKLGNPKKK